MTTSPSRFWLSSATGLAVVGLAAGGVLLAQPAGAGPAAPTLRSDNDATASDVTSDHLSSAAGPVSTAAVPSSAATGSRYRNGEYSATGSYLTPGGDESIGVTIVVAEGLVTDTAVRTEALSPTARQFQIQFAADIAPAVVGRDLAGLSVDRVAGASLTSVGFNDALVRIQTEAGN